ncbi:AAA family ATPase [Desulfobacterales bacterium HSG16]|nr:AAA family ATPase [Desulfobacterales bacterium HSG16]
MLQEIIFKNFKSYRKAILPLSPLTLLIGANASGKSNALEALRLLSWLAQGQSLSTIKHQIQDSRQIMRGQVNDLGYIGNHKFMLGCRIDHESWKSLEMTLEIRDDDLHIIDESISSSFEKFPLYRIARIIEKAPGVRNDVIVTYNNFARGGKKPTITCIDQMAVFVQLESAARFKEGHKKAQHTIPKVVRRFQKPMANILFLDTIPSLMRESGFMSDKTLRGDGKNLSGVLYNLWQKEENQEIILDFIRSLPEQDITTLSFYEGRRKDVTLELVESFGGQKKAWDVTLLSDGTLKVLAIVAALLSAPEGSIVVIEEVDNGVHPSRAADLLSSMHKQASLRNLRLLLTTHNPALMDSLRDESLNDVVFCYRDTECGDSRLIRLADMLEFPALAARGPLGQLVTQGVVDRFAKNPTTPDIKKQNALNWIASLRESSLQ